MLMKSEKGGKQKMKYVMLGEPKNFVMLGIKSVSLQTTENLSKLNFKLEGGYTLNVFGAGLVDGFVDFLNSEVTTATYFDPKSEDEAISFIELFDPVGENIYRY